jgi:hypothetical protein
MINQTLVAKTCNQCNKIIRGRTDKKFCNDYCRNSHNNFLKSPINNLIRNTNNQLSKNRRILESFLSPSESFQKIKKEKMIQDGFSFQYVTTQKVNKRGTQYHFCYDYGYIVLDEDWCIIIKSMEEPKR